MKRTLWLVTVLLAFALVACSGGGGDSGGDDATATVEHDSEPTSIATPVAAAEVGQITQVQPETSILRASATIPAGRNDPLRVGDELSTDDAGATTFEIEDVTTCNSYANTQVRIRPDDQTELEFVGGESTCLVAGADRTFGIAGEDVLLRNRGTIFRVSIVGAEVRISVLEGIMDVVEGERTTQVGPRQQLNLADGSLLPWQPPEGNLTGLLDLQALARELQLPRLVSPVDIAPGECFEADKVLEQASELESATIVDCEEEFDATLLKWVLVEAQEYPGFDSLVDFGIKLCDENDSYLIPTESQWNDLDVREIGCLALAVPSIG